MNSRTSRRLLLAVAVGAALVGVGLEAALDPIEDSMPGLTVAGLLLSLLVVGGVGGHWYQRALDRSVVDERERRIERHASRLGHGTLTVGLAVVLAVAAFTFVDLPLVPLLWALLVGSIAVHELSIEFYRRRRL